MFAGVSEFSTQRMPKARRSPAVRPNTTSRPGRGGYGGAGAGRGDATRQAFKPYHSINVPKSADLRVDAFGYEEPKPVTTAMLRNIPNRYTQVTLLQEIDSMGFAGAFDFFYLPMDIHNRTNVGYCFVNFCSNADFRRFTQRFMGYKFQVHPSGKIAQVSPATTQGFKANIMHFSNRAVTHSRNIDYRPVVVCGGERRDLGEVLAELQAAPAPEAELYDCWGPEVPAAVQMEAPVLSARPAPPAVPPPSPPPGLCRLAPAGPPPGLGWDFNPLAAEFVPCTLAADFYSASAVALPPPPGLFAACQLVPESCTGVVPAVPTFEEDSSFGLAKLDFENALRGLLQGNTSAVACSKEQEESNSSTEAGSEHCGSLSPRSATTEAEADDRHQQPAAMPLSYY